MAKESLKELLEFYRDNILQVQKDWYVASSRWADKLGHGQMAEVRLRAKEDVDKLHPIFCKKADLLGDLIPDLKELREGAPRDIDRALDFCEIDVRPFRMGYLKGMFYQVLKRLDLTNAQKRRIQKLGLSYVNWPGQRREMRELARLLIVVADKKFVEDLRAIADDGATKGASEKVGLSSTKFLIQGQI